MFAAVSACAVAIPRASSSGRRARFSARSVASAPGRGEVGGRGEQSAARSIDYDAYAALMRRIYKTIVADYESEDAEASIREDWQNDTKGSGGPLTKEQFYDAMFELAGIVSLGPQPRVALEAASYSDPRSRALRRRPVDGGHLPVRVRVLPAHAAGGHHGGRRRGPTQVPTLAS